MLQQQSSIMRTHVSRQKHLLGARMAVAYPAAQAEVVFDRLAVVLFSHNMINLVRVEADGSGEQAIFAPFARALTYQAT